MKESNNSWGGSREGSGPKKKEGYKFFMIEIPEQILGSLTDDEKKELRNFAEKAVLKKYSKIK